MTVIQFEKMNNKFGLHVYMPLVALISYILGNICLILEIQSIIYIIMYRKEIYTCFQPIFSIVVKKTAQGSYVTHFSKFHTLTAFLDAILNIGVMPGLPRWQTLDF